MEANYYIVEQFYTYRKKWEEWTYLQAKNADSDVENELVDTVGEGESGMNGESRSPYIHWK